MRVFENPVKNYLYLGYRLLSPIFDPVKFYHGVTGYVWFLKDYMDYRSMNPKERFKLVNFFPILDEKVSTHPFDAHYFYQEIWAFKRILKIKPKRHIDIASKYQFSGFVSTIVPSVYVDLRPMQANWENLSTQKGDVLHLPYKDNSVESISTLHVIEHIGLGRYGDKLDPEGTKKASKELTRVLSKGGRLYVSVPIGKFRICFNAHRVHPPELFRSYFPSLKLLEFSAIDDSGKFHENVDYKKFSDLNYGCGMFLFTKPK